MVDFLEGTYVRVYATMTWFREPDPFGSERGILWCKELVMGGNCLTLLHSDKLYICNNCCNESLFCVHKCNIYQYAFDGYIHIELNILAILFSSYIL